MANIGICRSCVSAVKALCRESRGVVMVPNTSTPFDPTKGVKQVAGSKCKIYLYQALKQWVSKRGLMGVQIDHKTIQNKPALLILLLYIVPYDQKVFAEDQQDMEYIQNTICI